MIRDNARRPEFFPPPSRDTDATVEVITGCGERVSMNANFMASSFPEIPPPVRFEIILVVRLDPPREHDIVSTSVEFLSLPSAKTRPIAIFSAVNGGAENERVRKERNIDFR